MFVKTLRLLLVFSSLISALFSLCPDNSFAAIGWTAAAQLQVARTNHAVAPISATRVFIAGGRTVGGAVISATEIYDATANSYLAGPPLNTPRESFTMTRLQNGTILIAGGTGSSGKLNSAEIYNPNSNTITPVNLMNAARSGHTATLLPDGTVLLAGGGSELAEIYNPATSSFSSTNGAMSADLTGHLAVEANGTVYVIGGRDAGGIATGSIQRYDVSARTFTTVVSLSAPRADFSATLLNPAAIIVVGGRSGTTSISSAEIIDVATNSVTPVAGALTTARYNHQSFLLPSGEVIIAGGSTTTTTLSSCETYKPTTCTFFPATSLPAPRSGQVSVPLDNRTFVTGGVNGTTVQSSTGFFGTDTVVQTGSHPARQDHTATRLASGKVLITGGYNSSGYLSSAELYDPATKSFTPTGTMSKARRYHTATLLANDKVLITSGYDATAELYDPATGTFTLTGNMATPRQNHTATLLADGRVLISGGYYGGYLATAELYDPATGSFVSAGSMNVARRYHTATLLANGKVLIAGGNGYSTELYDPATGSFTLSASMSVIRSNHTATLLANGQLLLVGGNSSNAELYDPSTATFGPLITMLTYRTYHAATLLADGKVLITGGSSADAELYDTTSGAFTITGSMSTVRDYHTATLLANGKVLIMGGYSYISGYLASAEQYDPAMATFTTATRMSLARKWDTATLLPSGKILVTGGYNSASGYLSSAELYDPATGSFTPTGSMTTVRAAHTANLLPNGKVLITGGFDNSAAVLPSAELYNPATGTFTPTGSMATGRGYHAATLLANGRVLITGNYTGTTDVAELYNPSTGIFTTTGTMNTARYRHTATLLPNRKVLIAGGYSNTSGYLDSAELYDPVTGAFSATGSMVSSRLGQTATLLPGGDVLIAGGENNAGGFPVSAELYNLSSGTFTTTGGLTTPRNFHTASLLPNGKVLIAGGFNGFDLAVAELYNPVNGAFASTGSMLTGREFHAATVIPDGNVLITGGNTAEAEIYDVAATSWKSPQNLFSVTQFSFQVRSETTGQPLAGVTIDVNGFGTKTTDSLGNASFVISRPGTFNVSLSADGYRSVTLNGLNISGYRYGQMVYMTPHDLLNITKSSLKVAQATVPYEEQVTFTGADWPYTISKVSGQLPPGVFLYPLTGQLTGTPSLPGSYTFMVRVADWDGWTTEREFTIEVSNPLQVVPVNVPRATATHEYLGVVGASGGTSPYTYSLSGSSWLSVDATGALRGTAPSLGLPTATQNFTITLRDALNRTTVQTLPVYIDQPLQLNGQRLYDGIRGLGYSQTLSASGGLPPYTWGVFSGTLPAGLILDGTTGSISGTPTTATRSVFVMSVTDAAGRVDYRDFVITIASPLQLQMTTSLPNGFKNEPYSELVKVSGGLPPFTFSYIGQLPAGLTLDPATGVIAGIPTIAGLSNLSITVQDSTFPAAQSVSKNMQSRIVTTLAITTSGALPNARKGVPVNPVVLTAKGGLAPYIWSLNSGSLPAGITLAGGALSGTPTKAGDYVFTLSVKDSAATPATETKQFICHVSDTLEIVGIDLPLAAVGVAFSQTLQASGGIPGSYSWRLVNGTLPNGLIFNAATGTILGIPTTRQSYAFTIEVSDGDFTPQVASRTFVIDVVDSLNIAETTVANAITAEAYTTTLHPLLGNPPYSWNIVSGQLPPGIVLTGSATTALLTGKPTTNGSYSFDMELRDSTTPPAVFTRRYTMVVLDTLTIQTSALKSIVRGVAYDEPLVVTGGTNGPYYFSLAPGSLPDGITLDSSTGRLQGVTNWPAGSSSEGLFQVYDSGPPSQTVTQTLLVKVIDPLLITTPSLRAVQNSPYSLALEAAGGVSPYTSWVALPTWAPGNNPLPPGLAISSTGIISGTPAQCGLFPARVKVTDSWTVANQTTRGYSFNVNCSSGNYMLRVLKDGTGAGIVSSAPAGISCGADCEEELQHNKVVTLTAAAATGSHFTGWSGACSGSSSTCSFMMADNMTATASFSLNSEASGSITANNGSDFANNKTVPLKLTASSPRGLITAMQFSIDEGPWSSPVAYAASYGLVLPAKEGYYAVSVRFQDAAGYYTPVYTAYITLDTTRPLIDVFNVPDAVNSPEIPVNSFIASDENGIAGYYIGTTVTPPASSSTSWSSSKPVSYPVAGITPGVPTTKVLYAFVKDSANNVSLVSSGAVVITVLSQSLAVTLQGTGSGAVNSTPAGINCTSGTCSAYFYGGTEITLYPTPAWNSDFIGWSDSSICATLGSCQTTITGPTSLTALFNGKPEYLIWLLKATDSTAYFSLSDALANATDGSVAQAPLNIFSENITFNPASRITVVIKGGYDPTFRQRAGYTTIQGIVTIGGRGKLVAERLKIKK